jgi:hypothetical protein
LVPYTSPGDQITEELLDKCIDPAHSLGGIPNGPVFIGIDVGHDEIYVVADYINRFGKSDAVESLAHQGQAR